MVNADASRDMRLSEARLGAYRPPDPFPSQGTSAFSHEVHLMLVATRQWLLRKFDFEPTMIEQHHYRRVASGLASYYASVGSDTLGGLRVNHIPREIFCRFRLEQGCTLSQIRSLLKEPKADASRYLLLEQESMHHE